MEFVHLVAPQGPLWRAWVAAHWERRLKRQDYQAADVQELTAFIHEKLQSIPFRYVGYLLLGLCRILRWKFLFFEEQADDIRSAVVRSEHVGLPVVAPVPDSAVTLGRISRQEPWDLFATLFPQEDGLSLLYEPELAPLEAIEASLLEGRRHTAPLDLITLAPASPALPPEKSEDAFGAPSQEDVAAMEALSQAASPAEPPELPADRGEAPAAEWLRARLPRLPRLPRPEAVRIAPLQPLMPPPTPLPLRIELPSIKVPTPATEGGAQLSTPQRLVRILDFDTPVLGPEEWPPRLVPSKVLLPDLLHLIEPSPAQFAEVPEELPHPADEVGLPPFAHVPEAEEVPAAEEVEPPSAEGRPVDEEVRPIKRRRRAVPWLDHETTIPKEVYNDTSRISLRSMYDYTIFLPHQSPQVGMTTTFGDLNRILIEPLQEARAVCERRRRARATLMQPDSGSGYVPSPAGIGAECPSAPVSSRPSPEASLPFEVGLTPLERPVVSQEEIPEVPPQLQPEEIPSAVPSEVPEHPTGPPAREEVVELLPAQETVSFFDLCGEPPGDAEAAARRFMGLLSLYMDGAVDLHQVEPYGDITIRSVDSGLTHSATAMASA